jgi:hypothetical protein
MNTLSEILKTHKLDIEILLNDHQTEITTHFKQLTDEVELLKEQLRGRDEQILKLSNEIKDNNFNNQNYQNFSLVSNLSKQIRERDLEIKTYTSQLRSAKKEIDALKEKLELISEKDEIEDLNHNQQTQSNVQLYIEEQSKLVDEPIHKQEQIEKTIEKTIEKSIEQPPKENKKAKDKPKKNEKNKELEPLKESIKEESIKEEIENVEEEEEVSYVRKKLKGKYYFVSDENPPQIYEYLEGNEVGALVGKMNNNKPEFL